MDKKSGKAALDSLHDMTEALGGILHNISERAAPDAEVSKFLGSVEGLKAYFEGLSCEECPSGQDLGIDVLSIEQHLRKE
ncbi:uncharacterized protein NEMAJ01_0015 [Nematocida major]|uniref:uncharacterized protein n=1 Tax=Nematocida major TaxID=1912982 RepID=UPI0020072081|nr:uncharacterized protein NEMAJ01_0015 [Nematocida major]KAH9385119.1 hypothetical protein NEMAJ01_0015 [Nematocida major]